ncbi:MAG TPA: hypothetical protein VNO79_00300 [Actinomycetota bacterium]|nr:hypothetical protein [Actinomycetota bacterium]
MASVEEFERRMNFLAEAQRRGPGRWVLVPQKGQRFLGPRVRERLRVRHRRRRLFVLLLEALGLSLLMGLFPPLRGMLYGSAVLGGLLLGYTFFLLRLRAEEVARARRRARVARRARRAVVSASYPAARAPVGSPRPTGTNGHRGQVLDEDVHVVVRRVGGMRGVG